MTFGIAIMFIAQAPVEPRPMVSPADTECTLIAIVVTNCMQQLPVFVPTRGSQRTTTTHFDYIWAHSTNDGPIGGLTCWPSSVDGHTGSSARRATCGLNHFDHSDRVQGIDWRWSIGLDGQNKLFVEE